MGSSGLGILRSNAKKDRQIPNSTAIAAHMQEVQVERADMYDMCCRAGTKSQYVCVLWRLTLSTCEQASPLVRTAAKFAELSALPVGNWLIGLYWSLSSFVEFNCFSHHSGLAHSSYPTSVSAFKGSAQLPCYLSALHYLILSSSHKDTDFFTWECIRSYLLVKSRTITHPQQ